MVPILDQFTRPVYNLPENLREDSELEEYRGHMIESFKLRNRAVQLGYTRGETQDKGYFYSYIKRIPGIGLEALIEFSGTPLPEENMPVALRSLWFRKAFQSEYGPTSLQHQSLGDVPPVLLSECWNDIRLIANEGSGFDADWEKKVGYIL